MKGHSLQGSCCGVNKNLDMLHVSKKKMIGFLDGIGSPVINDFLVGFIERALYEDPEIKSRNFPHRRSIRCCKRLRLVFDNLKFLDEFLWNILKEEFVFRKSHGAFFKTQMFGFAVF